MGQYVQLVIREIEASQRLNARPLRSVFFGGGERSLGVRAQAQHAAAAADSPAATPLPAASRPPAGTPSLIALPLLERLLGALDARFGLDPAAEISIEADPGTFDAARLRSYRGMGVNRVSVGVQVRRAAAGAGLGPVVAPACAALGLSQPCARLEPAGARPLSSLSAPAPHAPTPRQAFQDDLLALCGRAHDAADVYRAIEAVHAAGVPSWSLDLMSGLPQVGRPGKRACGRLQRPCLPAIKQAPVCAVILIAWRPCAVLPAADGGDVGAVAGGGAGRGAAPRLHLRPAGPARCQRQGRRQQQPAAAHPAAWPLDSSTHRMLLAPRRWRTTRRLRGATRPASHRCPPTRPPPPCIAGPRKCCGARVRGARRALGQQRTRRCHRLPALSSVSRVLPLGLTYICSCFAFFSSVFPSLHPQATSTMRSPTTRAPATPAPTT